MECKNIPVRGIRPGGLLDVYLPTLPSEFFQIREEDSANNFQKEILSVTSSAVYEQLQKDCSFDTLSYPDECSTLEEIVHVVPERSSELMKLSTHSYIPPHNMHPMSRTSLLGLLDRVPAPSVDLSYNNTVSDWNELSEKEPELLITVGVYKPMTTHQLDIRVQANYMVMSQRLVLLGSQSLADLKDAIRCPQDKAWLGDCSEALDDPNLHISSDKLYISSYFFIEGTFYDDMRSPKCKPLSRTVIEWAKLKKELNSMGPFVQKTMEKSLLRELDIHIGKPYFYLHQGNCEHVFVFLDVEVSHRQACQRSTMYPILTGRCYLYPLHCFVCRRINARWLASNADKLLPVDPCPICDVCIRLLLYNKDGEKIYPKMSVHMCCGDEFVAI